MTKINEIRGFAGGGALDGSEADVLLGAVVLIDFTSLLRWQAFLW